MLSLLLSYFQKKFALVFVTLLETGAHMLMKGKMQTIIRLLKHTNSKNSRPKNSWRRDLEADTQQIGHTWKELETMAQDRRRWLTAVDGLCPPRGYRHK